ncbi:AI-2E family transporter [Candidatus Protochlamydia sp. W-9]|uniref:AI-2E family transporter n=1 Tax=Candidatus Protochlamydia sp. W-9 TaxID=1785087 RepID=UPI0009AC08F8|nr:AI-2E family transporter [Candidatus Protochlamydia sp. W-9]
MENGKPFVEKRVVKRVFSPWYYNQYFKYSFGILLGLLIILVFSYVATTLSPIFNFVSSLFIPIVFSFLFYYLLRPLVCFFEHLKMSRFFSILLTYVLIGIVLVIFFAYLFPILATQIVAFANTSVETLEKVKNSSQTFVLPTGFKLDLEGEIERRLLNLIQYATAILSQNLLDIVGYLTRLATILAVIPFIVFYLLKDDHDFASGFLQHLPQDFGQNVRNILKNIDETLSNYINGLVLISFSVGSMLFIGYLIIGLKYALILSIMALVLTTIPYLGPFLAITPAVLTGLSHSPTMTLKVIAVFAIVQQTESNIVSPQIMGQRLNIHPLTLILLLLAAGSLYGLIGLLLATPFYAILKVLAENFYKIYLLRYPKMQAKLYQP